MLRARREIASEERQRAGAAVAVRVIASEEFARARRVVAYAPTADELPTAPLVEAVLAAGKTLLWPRVRAAGGIEVAAAEPPALARDAAGMLAPPPGAPAETLQRGDLVITPGLAFTRSGARLGRGGGYYDRLLAGAEAASLGVAFDIQLVDELPLEPHDRGVDLVATPSGLWRRVK
jgi:5-formyltetrahydrofolate cyclo-ligase